MNNLFLNRILENRNGMYIHALEVGDTYELESIIEASRTELFDEVASEIGEKNAKKQFIEFFQTMELYPLNEDNEDEIFNFDVEEYITQIV